MNIESGKEEKNGIFVTFVNIVKNWGKKTPECMQFMRVCVIWVQCDAKLCSGDSHEDSIRLKNMEK